jgi:hypothetical protein
MQHLGLAALRLVVMAHGGAQHAPLRCSRGCYPMGRNKINRP